MSEHTPLPWMTQPCGELLPNDVMIVADLGKLPNGIQQISTVGRALSIRQTPEGTAANAALIVHSVNALPALVKALEKVEAEARRYAAMYKPHSDGQNTFIIFADWVAALSAAAPAKPADNGEG